MSLPPDEKALIFKTIILIGFMRFSLAILPLKAVQKLAEHLNNILPESKTGIISTEKISWAVGVISWYLFKEKSCLSQALAAQVLLKQYKYPASVNFGVSKASEKELEAHAWVESGGKIITGKERIDSYTPLLTRKERI